MRIGSATNKRTLYASYYGLEPAGDSVFFLRSENPSVTRSVVIAGFLDTYAFDSLARARLGGLNLSEYVMVETALPQKRSVSAVREELLLHMAALMIPHHRYAVEWTQLTDDLASGVRGRRWTELWALTRRERLRRRCIVDAVTAELYGLSLSDYRWIMRDCDHPVEKVSDNDFARRLDPKGFWRVDRKRPPELRQSVLALVAFHDLQEQGLSDFIGDGAGSGWTLPKNLRLEDYGLGHDDRAKKPQPVASRLGGRFHEWQQAKSVDESWEACSRHSDLINAVVPVEDLLRSESDSEESVEDELPLFSQS